MTPSRRDTICPSWTLGRLKENFPGVELALYAYFGVGSRERSGFAASERLDDLLRRHLIFDAERACARLDAMAAEDWEYRIAARELAQQLRHAVPPLLLDARSSSEHALSRLPGSHLLSASSVALAKADPQPTVVTFCNDGSQSPAAARHLRGLGIPARHLHRGLTGWAIEGDENFPINYPLIEQLGRWHLLADGNSLRFRREQAEPDAAWRLWNLQALRAEPRLAGLLQALPALQLVAVGPRFFTLRGRLEDLCHTVNAALPWRDSEVWATGGEEPAPQAERVRLEEVLTEEAPRILSNHKGTVEIASYHDRVLTLRLGGGCAGCASASVTTQRELAAALYREVPLLDRIDSV